MGNPPQQVYVVPSTLVPVSWVVSTAACGLDQPSNCDDTRGGLFDQGNSKTWENVTNPNYLSLGVESSLGYQSDDGGYFGFDSIILGAAQGGISVDKSVVAAITTTDSYTGVLGLAARNVTVGNDTSTLSLLASLRNSTQIPSLSYGYTAGAFYSMCRRYRLRSFTNVLSDRTTASLVLGGYDASRFQPSEVSFDFGPDEAEYLNIGLQAITFTGSDGKSSSLLSTPIAANIDSTVSSFWLPNDTCNALMDAYGLQFDGLHQLYTINGSQHSLNVKNNPQALFKLSNNLAVGGASVSINFPYAAFDMNFTNPNSASAEEMQIFPLKQASSADQYTLGRAFLQEAVLVVDFERQNFSISQAMNVPTNTAAQIINIISPSDVGTSGGGGTTSPAPSPSSSGVTPVAASTPSSSSFPTGAIAGIVIAVVAIAAAILAFFCIRRRRSKKRGSPAVLDNEQGMAVKRPLVPELAVKSPEESYFSHPDSKAAPAYHVSETEVPEIDSPQMRGLPFAPLPHTDHIATVSELPANRDPAAELHSRSVSITSNSPPPGGFTYTSVSRGSPIAEDSLLDSRLSSPTAASTAEGAWNTSNFEPSSPESARSVPISRVRGKAHIVNPRSPTHGSPGGSIDNTGMSATIGSTGVHGLGLNALPFEELQRKSSQRSSQSTLVNGGISGRVSPEVGVGTSQTNPSAFASPELIPIQRPSIQRHDSGPDIAFLTDISPSETEGPR